MTRPGLHKPASIVSGPVQAFLADGRAFPCRVHTFLHRRSCFGAEVMRFCVDAAREVETQRHWPEIA
jgi:hypothetical protein